MRSRLMMPRISRAATVFAAASLVVVAAPVPAFADDVRADQWYLDALNVGKAHELSQGEGITIGLIDGGVDATHPDLKGNVKAGKDFGTKGKGLKDEDGHGTWTSSLIVGHGHGDGNADGVLGIAPKAEVVSVGVSTKDSSSKSGVADAITWLVDQDVDVISVSMSAGGDYDSVEYATARGIPVVASAGNCVANDPVLGEYENTMISWPAVTSGAIPVSGTTSTGKFWDCSIDLASAATQPTLGMSATGKDIMGAEKGGGHAAHSGTSSAPIVAGTLALIKSAYPDLSYFQWVDRLLDTVEDKGPSGFDDKFGAGIVNPHKALTEETTYNGPDGSQTSGPTDRVPLEDQGKNTGSEDKDKDGNKSDGDDNALTASSTSLLILILIAVAALLVVAFVVILVIAKRRQTNAQGRGKCPILKIR